MSYFKFAERHTNVRVEVMAGCSTFLTMAYIIFVNPNILAGTGMDHGALIAATCLVSGIATILVGLIANAPIAMAPGMGLNAFFATLVARGEMSWQTALGAVFISGTVFLVLTILGLRRWLVNAIPRSLIYAIAVGIGLFISFIGLTNLGLVVDSPHTLVSVGDLTPPVLMGLAGLSVMMLFEMLRLRGGLLVGILFTTILGVVFDPEVTLPSAGWFALQVDVRPLALQLDVMGALKWGLAGSIFSLMFVDMFDSVGTLVACCHQADMADEDGRVRGLDRLLGLDGLATMIGALLGTSTTTSYIESAAGIEQGGRTGLTAIVTGLLFFVALVFSPIIAIVPSYATAPALIMVGLFMMKEVRQIDFDDFGEGFPAFIIIVMIALSYSISIGLAFGFVSYVLIRVVSGRILTVKPALWIIALLSLTFILLDKSPEVAAKISEWLQSLETTATPQP